MDHAIELPEKAKFPSSRTHEARGLGSDRQAWAWPSDRVSGHYQKIVELCALHIKLREKFPVKTIGPAYIRSPLFDDNKSEVKGRVFYADKFGAIYLHISTDESLQSSQES
jgi:hypothetical protein